MFLEKMKALSEVVASIKEEEEISNLDMFGDLITSFGEKCRKNGPVGAIQELKSEFDSAYEAGEAEAEAEAEATDKSESELILQLVGLLGIKQEVSKREVLSAAIAKIEAENNERTKTHFDEFCPYRKLQELIGSSAMFTTKDEVVSLAAECLENTLADKDSMVRLATRQAEELKEAQRKIAFLERTLDDYESGSEVIRNGLLKQVSELRARLAKYEGRGTF